MRACHGRQSDVLLLPPLGKDLLPCWRVSRNISMFSAISGSASAPVKVKVTQSCLTLCNPMSVQSMEFSRLEYWSGQPFPSPGDLPTPGIEPRSSTLQADSLPAEPQGKPKNTGVGSLSVLQRIFQTQGSNLGLLHCRQILYQLSFEGSPWELPFPSLRPSRTVIVHS